MSTFMVASLMVAVAVLGGVQFEQLQGIPGAEVGIVKKVGQEILSAYDRDLYVLGLDGAKFVHRFPSRIVDLSGQDDRTFVSTEDEVFVRLAPTEIWESIFQSHSADSAILSVGELKGSVFVGTEKGLIEKAVMGGVWRSVPGRSGAVPVYEILESQGMVVAATASEVILYDPDSEEQVVLWSTSGREQDESPIPDAESAQAAFRQILDVVVPDPQQPDIMIATQDGILVSADQGESWQRLPMAGLPSNAISRIFVSPSRNSTSHGGSREIPGLGPGISQLMICAATSKGAFLFDPARWIPVYQGLPTLDIRDLAIGPFSQMYLATDRGVFVADLAAGERKPTTTGQSIDPSEPTIAQVQALAIAYAEVDIRKIRDWRAAAKRRALLPSVSVGLDRADTNLFHWDSGANPDELIKGRDFVAWDLTVAWDLGDLIWNPDQTSIDSRSKLMVELREDILDQVTRVYFERRRLQAALRGELPGDVVSRFDQELRMAELTALLDGYTGGKFSQLSQKDSQTAEY